MLTGPSDKLEVLGMVRVEDHQVFGIIGGHTVDFGVEVCRLSQVVFLEVLNMRIFDGERSNENSESFQTFSTMR
jgi:hypothetical protein